MICVAGVPRSGTSLVTQLLHRCGVYLGPPDQLMPASINNSDGFWENLAFVRFNERLLAENGGRWFAPPATIRATPQRIADAKAIVAEFEGEEPWGWKDPRNALTLSFWSSLLPSMKVLVCVRHPAETASSLAASTLIARRWPLYWTVTRPDSPMQLRDAAARFHQRLWGTVRTLLSVRHRRELIYQVGLELWRVSNTRILEETSAANRIVTHYDAVLTEPRVALKRILRLAGIHVPPGVVDEAVSVVSPRLRHHRAHPSPLTPEIAALYAQLLREAAWPPQGP